MSQALNAYQRTAKQSASGRELEANLLMQAAAQMQRAQQTMAADRTEIEQAVEYNRRLWTVLVTSVIAEDNPIPVEIKQNFVNLTAYVMKKSVQIIAKPTPAAVEQLVSINSDIAAGLRGR